MSTRVHKCATLAGLCPMLHKRRRLMFGPRSSSLVRVLYLSVVHSSRLSVRSSHPALHKLSSSLLLLGCGSHWGDESPWPSLKQTRNLSFIHCTFHRRLKLRTDGGYMLGSANFGPSRFGSSSLKKLAAQKCHSYKAIPDNFATWSRMSPDWNKMSSIGKWRYCCVETNMSTDRQNRWIYTTVFHLYLRERCIWLTAGIISSCHPVELAGF